VILKLLCFLIAFPIGAAVFEVQTIKQQLKEADGVIIGHYLRSRPMTLEDGSLVTQMVFKMNKEFGLQSDLFGMDEVIVHYPDAKKVEGVPSFVSGEKVVLMIKTRDDRYWGLNLGLGSFKVINYGNEKLIINSVFPEDRRVSQQSLEEFEKDVRLVKGSNLKIVSAPVFDQDRHPASEEAPQDRTMASKTDESTPQENQLSFSSLWLMMILALMGGVYRLNRQK
jgi:hypothetical protein